MKYIWTDSDIVAGRIVCKPASYHFDDRPWAPTGSTAKWMFKIGFINGGIVGEDDANYVLIAMTDGRIGKGQTRKALAAYLNHNEMTPAPHKWVMETMEMLRDEYQS